MRLGLDWMNQASCPGIDPTEADWFPHDQADVGHERLPPRCQRAVEICNRCPVRAECLDYALRIEMPYGIWGGLTSRQRKTVRRRGAIQLKSAAVATR